MSGTIGVMSGEFWHADFALSLMHQQTPPGAKLINPKGIDIVGNMNAMVRGMKGDWLWILGTDHLMNFDCLMRLLAHEVEVVVPLCLKRSPPYDPVVYSHQNEKGEYVGYNDLPEHGLIPVHAAGSAGMLVRREILDALATPDVFASHGGLNEDLSFCARVRDELGVQIWCDVDTPIGHIGANSVWPRFKDGEWKIDLHLGNNQIMPINRIVKPELAAA